MASPLQKPGRSPGSILATSGPTPDYYGDGTHSLTQSDDIGREEGEGTLKDQAFP